MELCPVDLEGRHVRLEAIAAQHAEDLWRAAQDPAIWRYMPCVLQSPEQVSGWIQLLRTWLERGEGLGFATRDLASGELAGSTAFLAAVPAHGRVEIGATWLSPRFQRSAVNTEAKLLMLRHAFDTWGCQRVEFKTDVLNQASRRALVRIGASEEGTLRNHMRMPDGRIRHSVYYSVTREEWPDVATHLGALLERHR